MHYVLVLRYFRLYNPKLQDTVQKIYSEMSQTPYLHEDQVRLHADQVSANFI